SFFPSGSRTGAQNNEYSSPLATRMAPTIRHLGQVRTCQMHTESGQEMMYHPDYNLQKPVTHAGPPQNDFLFKRVRVCHRCFHFMFLNMKEGGCQARKLSVSYPSLEPVLGPC